MPVMSSSEASCVKPDQRCEEKEDSGSAQLVLLPLSVLLFVCLRLFFLSSLIRVSLGKTMMS